MAAPQQPMRRERGARPFAWFLALLSVTVTVGLYLYLIGSNCESTGVGSLLEAVQDFHTAEGC